MDTQLPGVAVSSDLLRLTSEIFDFAVFHLPLPGGDLPVGAEFDAVRGVDVNHLDWPFKPSF